MGCRLFKAGDTFYFVNKLDKEEKTMSKKIKKIFITLFTAICISSLVACGITADINANSPTNNPTDNTAQTSKVDGEYRKGIALVKYDGEFTENMISQLGIKSATKLYNGSKWYSLVLRDENKTEETVNYLTELGCFEKVDYDYVMNYDGEVESVDVSANPDWEKQKNHPVHKIPEGWEEVKKNGKHPGGSEDVIVAVIDTGVDYTHLDLRNNIWRNPAEIPGNGIDDDKNGYVDDINGWDCVGNDKDPMDDNGHGTHVAGIIAMENNKIGGVGVAYNCKIMCLKAGNSSGYFNNSDIAEAVQYAYMNGASVINMSFGGSSISIAVEEALENAYNSCVLVAAAGNDGKCNSGCITHPSNNGTYPAALPYVIGVMSTDESGTEVSGFSNYDHRPYDSVEYEVYAVGEGVPSTFPNNKYATLNGTSMAAPTVSGIAALLRSAYPDRETYSTKYLQSQIVNTGTVNPYNVTLKSVDNAHSVTNVYEALTKIPTPDVNLYEYSISDATTISNKNNGNGVIDAGETVRLYVSLQNRGGVASNVNVSIDTYRSEIGDETLTDPYFTFVNSTIQLSDIGTYSVRESGDKYFEIIVDEACPNDYLVNFNIRFTYENGLDENDNTVYEDDGKQKAQFNVSKGYLLPSTITEDTVYTADRLYIVGADVIIPEGVTVTFEAGCEIQFYDDREYYNSPVITVYGTLNFNGTQENIIKIAPNERHSTFACFINSYGNVSLCYVDAVNLFASARVEDASFAIALSILKQNRQKSEPGIDQIVAWENGLIRDGVHLESWGDFNISESYIEMLEYGGHCYTHVTEIRDSFILRTVSEFSAGNNRLAITNTIILSEHLTRTAYPVSMMLRESKNNMFLSNSLVGVSKLVFIDKSMVADNQFSPLYQQYASQVIDGYYDANGNPTVDVYGSLADASLLWPHVVSVEAFDKDGNPITTMGKEEIKVRVTFNRPMDKNAGTFLTFGTIEPYADYRINGEYISDTVWEGTYTLKSQIENGQNFFKVNNAWAEEDKTKTVFGEYQLHEFTIDTTAAMSMNLQAEETEKGIELTFVQDDYDTLLGYNIYRSTEKDGNYLKLNPAIILPTENTFVDENAEPGKTYWYTYTVVLSDFTESNPAGKVMATAMDTINPTVYHTPINQGYQNNNLVISCTASDNVAISTVTLYYRTYGETAWKTLVMSKINDKYSATVFGSELTLEGLEYYIVASDGRNLINKGSQTSPYFVVIKDASTISTIGDVDGNGAVTTKDALMLMQCLNGDLILSDDQFRRADLNKDGVLSSVEALRILQYINGKVTTLEM